jgi:hypothetical protein
MGAWIVGQAGAEHGAACGSLDRGRSSAANAPLMTDSAAAADRMRGFSSLSFARSC